MKIRDNDPTIIFEAVKPWGEPVAVAGLLNDIEAVLNLHVILPPAAATALAVWVLHTYTFELRDTVAYVAIESPEKRCGKTTLLSVLAAMAHKPLIAANVTVAALFRAIDTCRPALFIDEADTFLAGNATMRGIINSGNAYRTAYILRLSRPRRAGRARAMVGAAVSAGADGAAAPAGGYMAPSSEFGDSDSAPSTVAAASREEGLKRFSCWCPKVIAMIGQVPETIADRSMVVRMNRKLVSETCAPLAELDTAEIRSKCARFARDAAEAIAQAPRIRGEGLNDRAADTYDPLYVIARLAGPEWERKLQAAALALAATALSQNPSAELLLDILSICKTYQMDKIFSSDLLMLLQHGKAAKGVVAGTLDYSKFTEHRVALMLRPYGVRPTSVRIEEEVFKGYTVENLRAAVERYVPKAETQARVKELMQRDQLIEELVEERRQRNKDKILKA